MFSKMLKILTMENIKIMLLIIYLANISLVDADNATVNGEKTGIDTNGVVGNKAPQNVIIEAGKRYVITSKDDREETVLAIPIERPFTPVHSSRNRSLYPVRIVIGESLCIYTKYTYFFREAADRDMLPFELLMNATVTIRNEDYYFYDAEDLCISVDDALNVDIWQFDCSPAGVCVCGIYFGYVDIDIPPMIKDGQIKYLQVNALDRKLVVENGECKSGLKGHCSLLDSNVSTKTPLRCSNLYDCILDESYGPILTNVKTNQTYGICLPKKKGSLSGRSIFIDDDVAKASNAFSIIKNCGLLHQFTLFVFILLLL